MKLGITAKVSLLLALVGLLAAGLTGFYVYQLGRDLLNQSAKSQLLTATQVLAQRVALTRQEVSRNLQVLANQQEALAILQHGRAEDAQHMAALFEQMMRANPAYLQVRLIDASHFGLESVRVDRDGKRLVRVVGDDLQEKGHFPYVYDTLHLSAGGIYLSPIVINHERGSHAAQDQPTALLATPVVDAQSKTVGVVAINVDLNASFSSLSADLLPDEQLFMATAEGDFIIHPDPTHTFGFDRGRRILVQDEFPATLALVTGQADHVLLESPAGSHAEQPVVAAFIKRGVLVTSNESGFILGIAQPLPNMLENATQLSQSLLKVMGGIFLGCVFFAVLLARAVTRPINAMSQAVQQFGQDLQTSILPEQREDEIGLLARSFRQMQNQIQTQLAELNQRRHDLEYLARHDTLTGLPNRRLFGERLEQALAQARRRRQGFALIFVDLDRFKDINDNLGHEAGDAVLQTVALRLKNDTREVDTVARLGGDEFVVLLDTYTNRHQLVTVAEKLLETLSQPMDVLGRQLTVGASMGISQYPLDGLSANELLARADQAMYATKAAGRNGYRFFSDESDENQQLSIAEIP